MEFAVLLVHLVVCICLIGLVLLQRSEGGALGMGGGGGGSLMSGRGAADALARMTSVAGGFFLVTSLGLTFLSGASASSDSRSVFDRVPATQTTPAPSLVPPADQQPQQPDPTESSAPEAAETQLASIDAQASAPQTNTGTGAAQATRAAPIETRPAAQPTRTPTPTSAGAQTTRSQTSGATAPPPSAPAQQRPLVIPNTSGAISGVALEEAVPESGDTGALEAVRRERAGPDQ